MDRDWFGLLERPALWERSAAPFWDDEHISRHMLEAHLAPDVDAASRKRATIERSVRWLSGLIPAGARLLDLGCGPGLYAKRLSALGYRVMGMDVSRRSIAYAAHNDAATRYVRKNYLELDETGAFGAVILIYGDYAALTAAERRTLLRRVKDALVPGGVFLFDVFTDVHFRQKTERTRWTADPLGGGFWSAAPYVCLQATYLYENGTVSADTYVVITGDGVTRHIIWDTAYTKETLANELLAAGFSVKGFYNDVCGSPCTADGETLCCVACR